MEYISKKDETKKQARVDFENKLLPKVREYLNKNFGKKKWTFNSFIVGSAKRNLILLGNEGFDIDYQLKFFKIPKEYLNDAKKTKNKLREYFDKANDELGLGLTYCEDSTHVLTMKKLDGDKIIYSYDIAILRLNNNEDYIILKNEKQGKDDDYHYVELSDCESFNEKYKKVKTPKAWDLLRKKYKAKKEEFQNTNKDERPASFSLLGQTVNEVIQELRL